MTLYWQVCIQVAATVGCKAIGIEVIPQRHEAGLALVVAFDAVLKEVSRRTQVSCLTAYRIVRSG